MNSRSILICGLIFCTTCAGATPIVCPPRYLVPAARVVAAAELAEGWTAVFHGNLPLRGAAVVEGPPEENGDLVPEIVERSGGRVDEIYSDLNADSGVERWASCSYFDSTSSHVSLARKLPPTVRRCVARYLRQGGKKPDKFLSLDCD